MTYIYLDVLIITNIYVNYFILKATARLSHSALSIKRCIIASIFGSVFSFTIFLPDIGSIFILGIKLAGALLIVRIAFSRLDLKRFLKLTVIFFVMSFVFAGVIYLICQITETSAILVNNYSVYFDISLVTLAVSTIVAYVIICLISYILDKKMNINHSYKVMIEMLGKKLSLNAICDTGNSLIDTFTGKPVIVCNSLELCNIVHIDENVTYDAQDYLELLKDFKGVRLLPYSTIGNNGVIPAFLADRVYISNEKNEIKSVDAYIGISPKQKSEFEAIFNPRLLI